MRQASCYLTTSVHHAFTSSIRHDDTFRSNCSFSLRFLHIRRISFFVHRPLSFPDLSFFCLAKYSWKYSVEACWLARIPLHRQAFFSQLIYVCGLEGMNKNAVTSWLTTLSPVCVNGQEVLFDTKAEQLWSCEKSIWNVAAESRATDYKREKANKDNRQRGSARSSWAMKLQCNLNNTSLRRKSTTKLPMGRAIRISGLQWCVQEGHSQPQEVLKAFCKQGARTRFFFFS